MLEKLSVSNFKQIAKINFHHAISLFLDTANTSFAYFSTGASVAKDTEPPQWGKKVYPLHSKYQ